MRWLVAASKPTRSTMSSVPTQVRTASPRIWRCGPEPVRGEGRHVGQATRCRFSTYIDRSAAASRLTAVLPSAGNAAVPIDTEIAVVAGKHFVAVGHAHPDRP